MLRALGAGGCVEFCGSMNELHPPRDYKSHGIASKPDAPPETGSSDDGREVIEMKFAWAVREAYRLDELDRRVEKTGGILSNASEKRIDTSAAQAILTRIGEKRPAFESALSTHDKDALEILNKELKTLWEEFRDALRNYRSEIRQKRPADGEKKNPLSAVT
jgi:hypothetical protein